MDNEKKQPFENPTVDDESDMPSPEEDLSMGRETEREIDQMIHRRIEICLHNGVFVFAALLEDGQSGDAHVERQIDPFNRDAAGQMRQCPRQPADYLVDSFTDLAKLSTLCIH